MEGKENKMEVTGNSTEEEKGRRVWVRQGRIRIDEQWWEWNEEKEVLRQERENVKGGKQGTQKEEKRGGTNVEEKREMRSKGIKEWRVVFWNVAGLKNKDRDFWRRLSDWEMIVLSETWLDNKRWDRIREYLPKGYGA